MKNPNAEELINFISQLANKTIDAQENLAEMARRLINEAKRVRDGAEDISAPLSDAEIGQTMVNVAQIMNELKELAGFYKTESKRKTFHVKASDFN